MGSRKDTKRSLEWLAKGDFSRYAMRMKALFRSIILVGLPTLALSAETLEPEKEFEKEPEPPRQLCANVGVNQEPRNQCVALDNYPEDICGQIRASANRHGLPLGFFARLIWKESLFDANAVSHMGAEGIAQFIPSTARLRGLKNSFNPVEALDKSAAYLAELDRRFGSLGMAAVAYNAGENRAEAFLNGSEYMPYETQDYVMTITGQSVETWRKRPAIKVDYALSHGKEFLAACLNLVAKRSIKQFVTSETAQWMPYGVELGAHLKLSAAKRIFQRVKTRHAAVLSKERAIYVRARNRGFGTKLRYTVRVGRKTRGEAVALCRRIRVNNGFCTVKRNPR